MGGGRKKILYVLYIHPVWSSGIGIKIKKIQARDVGASILLGSCHSSLNRKSFIVSQK
jgi:hypothetical protein